jgi:hypothetical protein
VAAENVIAENQARWIAAHKFCADKEDLGESFGAMLHCVFEAKPPLPACSKQVLERALIS